ncbi:MAG: insulinase family protein [Candidatus Eremiobacteraeota bacterium]|nr:insulinase family protein [Candidatus Eremiobacteraeota bacterium]
MINHYPKGALDKQALQPPFAVLASDINRYVLDNGLVVLTKEVYPSNVVFLSLWVKVGSTDETDEKAGLSHFVEHMLFKNTKKRNVGQVAQEIHSLGGYLNGFTSFDCTSYWIVLPGKHFHKALEIQFDAAFNPQFDQKEVDKERKVILEEIKMYRDRPADYLGDKLMSHAFTKHRYGRPIIGYKEVVEETTTEDLKQYYHSFYKPNNCFILAVGNIETMDMIRRAERTYRKLKEGAITRNSSPKEPPQKTMERFEMEGDIFTGHMQFAIHIPSIFSKEIYACDILASILGQGKSSRLYRELREERKLVNSISANTYIQKDPGILFVDAELSPENIEDAEKAIIEVVTKLADEGFTEEEFIRAKSLNESSYIYGQETVEGQGRKIGSAEAMGDYMLAQKFIPRLMMTDANDTLKVARKYLKTDNMTIGIYKPKK